MKLTYLKIKNFRSFYGESEIEFTIDKNKNITLIHGENGVGKTTILNAILWCLYEQVTPNFRRPKELINKFALKQGGKSAWIEVRFINENKEYVAKRSVDISSAKTKFKIHEKQEFNYQEVPNARAFINSIVPSDMAEYFFFHGEGIQNINAKKSGKDVRKAIRDILGFSLAETAISDLNALIKKVSSEVATLTNVSHAQKKRSREIESHYEVLDEARDRLNALKAEEVNLRKDESEFSDKLKSTSIEDVNRLQKEIEELERRKFALGSQLKSHKIEKTGLISKYGWVVFGYDLYTSAIDFIDESSLKGKVPSPYDEQLVSDLLEEETCICGRDLKPGTEAYFSVQSLIEKASNADMRNKLMKARSMGSMMESEHTHFYSEYTKLSDAMSQLDAEIRDCLITLEEKEKERGLIDEEEIKILHNSLMKCRDRIQANLRDQGRQDARIESSKTEIDRLEGETRRESGTNDRLDKLIRQKDFVAGLVDVCTRTLQEYEESSKLEIVRVVNETLHEFSRKDYSVKMDDDYVFHLVGVNKEIIAPSDGEKLLLNLAFISALLQHSEKRSGATGDILVPGTVAPFVIDAPFGELDDTYKKATAKFLPERADQLVLLLSTSHWKGTVESEIDGRVGAEYLLISNKMSERGSKPLDMITINGVEKSMSKYEQEFDGTTIERVM